MRKSLVFILCFLFVFSFPMILSAQERKPNPAKRSKKLNAPTIYGSSGIFEIFNADNLRKGEFNFGINYHHFDRDPGALGVDIAPVTIAVGLHERIEFFVAAEVHRQLHPKNIRPYTHRPGQPLTPTQDPLGRFTYANVAPFVDVPFGTGAGDFFGGFKFNLLSERRGAPLGVAMRAWVKVPSARHPLALSRGRGTGRVDGGYDAIISKYAGPIGLNLNLGITFRKSPVINNVTYPLHHEFTYGGSVNVPTTSRIQGIFEVDGTKFIRNIGLGLNDRVNPRDPVELIWGARFYPVRWASFGGGYRLNTYTLKDNPAQGIIGTKRHGFVAQVAFHRRINEPPTATCEALEPTTLIKGGTARVHVTADDPEDDPLTISWRASGGTIQGSGETVTFTAPRKSGVYTVTAEVADDSRATATCSVQLTVQNRPPVVKTEPDTVTITKGESTTIRAIASDPDNDPLTYQWAVNDQTVSGATESQFTFDSKDRDPGTYKVTVTVSDGEATASASSTVTVIAPPPKVKCTAQPTEAFVGDRVKVSVAVEAGESPFTYEWSVTPGGKIEGTGAEVTFDTSGLEPGTYTVNAKVSDARGRSDTCSVTIKVSRKEPEKVVCDGLRPGRTRVRNDCKAALDRVAEAMKSDPNLTITITGYTDNREGRNVGLRRAQSASTYLTREQRIDKNRIKVVNGGSSNPVDDNRTTQGRAKNRRIEVEFTAK